MFNLAFYPSHNAAVAISFHNQILEVVEVERLLNLKNASLVWWNKYSNTHELVLEIERYFRLKYGVKKYNVVISNSPTHNLDKLFPADHYETLPHHQAHAYGALYQSPHDQALIFSFDGGSDEGCFNVYLGKKQETLQKVYAGHKDYAVAYMMPTHYIKDIRQEDIYTGNLVYAGKLMGLAGFGRVNEKYIEPLTEFYNSTTQGQLEVVQKNFIRIFEKFGIKDDTTRLEGQDAWDLAATNQYVFEKLFEEESRPILDRYPGMPVILVGGCGLNIINNTRLSKTRTVFVPPNPNDCGLAMGLLASVIHPTEIVDCTYIGPEVWDKGDLARILYEREGRSLNLNQLADDLIAGKIYGVVRGRAEHGPRALGNRSIICDTTIDGMKDTLNARVKGREYYRPFAPVVRLEDVNKYFHWDQESKWMGFCPEVREEYRDVLKAITHVDGTARVQTVTREQNAFLYDLLTLMHEKKGIGVILNTSFNIAGKPILNTYKDALWVLDNKDMDGLILEDYCITKSK
jgi:carbamoyltransferase